MPSDLDAVFYIQTPPRVSLEDGMFRVSFDVGKRATFELVMSPATFLKMRAKSAEVVAKWQLDDLDKVKKIGRH